MAYVSRDPFAREEIHRERDYEPRNRGCDECGQTKTTPPGKKHPKGRRYLFQYRVETDGGRKSDIRGQFCSVGCMRQYHS